MDREELREALREELRASGRFSEVEEVDLRPAPEPAGIGAAAHRVHVTFAPSVRVADPERFTKTVRDRFGEVLPEVPIEGSDYEEPEPATAEQEELRIRPARGPTVVLTVRGLTDRLGGGDRG